MKVVAAASKASNTSTKLGPLGKGRSNSIAHFTTMPSLPHPLIKEGAIDARLAERRHPVDKSKIRIQAGLTDMVGITSHGLHKVVLPADEESTVIHYHRQDDEWMYILSGSGTLLLNDATEGDKIEEHLISPGDFIGFKGGEGAENYAHSFRADQGVDLVYLVGGSRAPLDICHYPLENKMAIIDRGNACGTVYCQTPDLGDDYARLAGSGFNK